MNCGVNGSDETSPGRNANNDAFHPRRMAANTANLHLYVFGRYRIESPYKLKQG
jgi:hypothetical protein